MKKPDEEDKSQKTHLFIDLRGKLKQRLSVLAEHSTQIKKTAEAGEVGVRQATGRLQQSQPRTGLRHKSEEDVR